MASHTPSPLSHKFLLQKSFPVDSLKISLFHLTPVLPFLFWEISTCRNLRRIKYVSYTLHLDSLIVSILALLLSLCLSVSFCLSVCLCVLVSVFLSVPLSVSVSPPTHTDFFFILKHLRICHRAPHPKYPSICRL